MRPHRRIQLPEPAAGRREPSPTQLEKYWIEHSVWRWTKAVSAGWTRLIAPPYASQISAAPPRDVLAWLASRPASSVAIPAVGERSLDVVGLALEPLTTHDPALLLSG